MVTMEKLMYKGLILLVFAAVLGCIAIISSTLNEEFVNKHPSSRPFMWGYFVSLTGMLNAVFNLWLLLWPLTLMDSPNIHEVPHPELLLAIPVGFVYYLMFKRNRIAWIIGTIMTMNPIVWVINSIYLKHRWKEMSPDKEN